MQTKNMQGGLMACTKVIQRFPIQYQRHDCALEQLVSSVSYATSRVAYETELTSSTGTCCACIIECK